MRVGRLASLVFRWLAVGAGFSALLWLSLRAFGGKAHLWAFNWMMESRYASMELLAGSLHLRNGIQSVTGDEQIYNGAAYTNWGYGVPLLQLPFHAIAHPLRSTFPARFFPDRAIYFFWFSVLAALLWLGFNRLLAARDACGGSRARRLVLSWAATLFTLVCALYPLMRSRFYVYEETICYLEIFELAALVAYLFAVGRWRAFPVIAMGAAAGMGLLIRPTGAGYAVVWIAMVVVASRRLKPVALFAAGLVPFVAFWMWTNHVRSGSPFSMGFANSMPGLVYHTPILRFGPACSDTPGHFYESVVRLLRALFVQQPTETSPWMSKCHFDLELRPPESSASSRDAFISPFVLVALLWILASHLVRRERRLEVYAPLGAIAALFVTYAVGGGFAWRYAGDFWPLVVLACVEYVRTLPAAGNRLLGAPLALAFVVGSALVYLREVSPAASMIKPLPPESVDRMWSDFEDTRFKMDPTMPSRRTCLEPLSWPLHNMLGWHLGVNNPCTVDTFTNIFLGIPQDDATRHTLRFEVDHAEPTPLRVVVNGRRYKTRTDGNAYLVDLDLDASKFVSPIVQATIEWVRVTEDPPNVKLEAVELQ
ncbi:MAG TPA: hypothetical protein VIY73_25120 [Polyangiaceae bacterium]